MSTLCLYQNSITQCLHWSWQLSILKISIALVILVIFRPIVDFLLRWYGRLIWVNLAVFCSVLKHLKRSKIFTEILLIDRDCTDFIVDSKNNIRVVLCGISRKKPLETKLPFSISYKGVDGYGPKELRLNLFLLFLLRSCSLSVNCPYSQGKTMTKRSAHRSQ